MFGLVAQQLETGQLCFGSGSFFILSIEPVVYKVIQIPIQSAFLERLFLLRQIRERIIASDGLTRSSGTHQFTDLHAKMWHSLVGLADWCEHLLTRIVSMSPLRLHFAFMT